MVANFDEDNADMLTPLVFKCIAHFNNPNANVRRFAVSCCNQFILISSPQFNAVLPQFIQALYQRTSDTDSEVRKVVIQALVMIVEVNIDVLLPAMNELVAFMLSCSQDSDELVAQEACEFWLVFTEQSVGRFELGPLLPKYVEGKGAECVSFMF